jgi:hypothetical protein
MALHLSGGSKAVEIAEAISNDLINSQTYTSLVGNKAGAEKEPTKKKAAKKRGVK